MIIVSIFGSGNIPLRSKDEPFFEHRWTAPFEPFRDFLPENLLLKLPRFKILDRPLADLKSKNIQFLDIQKCIEGLVHPCN